MKKILITIILCSLHLFQIAAQNQVVRVSSLQPIPTHKLLMDEIFGASGWDDLHTFDLELETLLTNRRIIWLDEAWNDNDRLMNFFLQNRAAFERWVVQGGILLLNIPQSSFLRAMDLGFGGITAAYPSAGNTFEAVVPPHPVISGPYQPVGNTWSGTTGASIEGPGLQPILVDSDANDLVVLGEKRWGGGTFLVGGLNHLSLQIPESESTNLRRNLLDYMKRFQRPELDAGISAFHPSESTCVGPGSIQVEISNYGRTAIHSATVAWTLNGAPQPPVSFQGFIDTPDNDHNTAVVELFNSDFEIGSSRSISAWIGSINGLDDPNNEDDSLSGEFNTRLSGNFTIGGADGDYSSIVEAVADLERYGICDAVVYNIRPGVYREQVVIPEIVGASADHTITFRSESGVHTDVTWIPIGLPPLYTPLAIWLNGADWIRLEGVSLDAREVPTSNFSLIRLGNGATHNTFSNNRIAGPLGDRQNEGVYIYGEKNDHNQILNNYFDGNSVGVYSAGPHPSDQLEIRGNVFSRQYYHAVYLQHIRTSTIINNRISDYAGSILYYSGIKVYRSTGAEIGGNFLRLQRGSGGIVLDEVSSPEGNSSLIANNFVQIGGSGNPATGISVVAAQGHQIYHNTVRIDRTDAESHGIFLGGGTLACFPILGVTSSLHRQMTPE